MTLYPVSKCTPQRAVDMVEMYGPERLLVNSAGDWGPSKPTAVPDFILAMRLRGHPESLIRRDRLRKPAGVLQPKPRFSVHAARAAGDGGAVRSRAVCRAVNIPRRTSLPTALRPLFTASDSILPQHQVADVGVG